MRAPARDDQWGGFLAWFCNLWMRQDQMFSSCKAPEARASCPYHRSDFLRLFAQIANWAFIRRITQDSSRVN
jgi:hypothetical protein